MFKTEPQKWYLLKLVYYSTLQTQDFLEVLLFYDIPVTKCILKFVF